MATLPVNSSKPLVAAVTTAVPMDDALRDKVVQKLQQKLHCQVELEEIIDPEILGGLIVSVGDIRMDASIHVQLDAVRKHLKDAIKEGEAQ